MIAQLVVGPQLNGDGAPIDQRGGRQGEAMVSELHGRFYEQNLRGNLFTFGISNTALVAANAIATGLTATAQPVIGIYNPLSSGVNLVVLQASIVQTTIANSAAATGGFMWVGSAGNGAVTLGSAPFNCRTLSSTGSQARAFAVSTALTGLSNNLVAIRGTSIAGINAAGPATAITQPQSNCVENVDGSFIVPPGGVLAIMGQVSTTTINVTVGLLWEEVPA